MKLIKFKSIPEFWRKEYLGLKPNTIRKQTEKFDERFEFLDMFIEGKCNLLSIIIENTETHEVFERVVTDVSKFQDIYIISWRHE